MVAAPYVAPKLLSTPQLIAVIICSFFGLLAVCACVFGIARNCFRRGLRQAEAARDRDLAARKRAAPAPLAAVRVDAAPAGESNAAHSPNPLAPAAAALPSAPRADAAGLDAAPAMSPSRSEALLVAAVAARASRASSAEEKEDESTAAAARVSVSMLPTAEPADGPPVPQPPAWATQSFVNPLGAAPGEASPRARSRASSRGHVSDEEEVAALGSPRRDRAAAWHALGAEADADADNAPPAALEDGRNPLFEGGHDDDVAADAPLPEATPTPAPRGAEAEAETDEGLTTPSTPFASPDASVFATPGSVLATPGSAQGDDDAAEGEVEAQGQGDQGAAARKGKKKKGKKGR